MEIKYFGHSCFRLKDKKGTVVVDPYTDEIGVAMPKLSAEIVAVTHPHFDHNNISAIKGTIKREKPFVVDGPGEYEIAGIGIFGFPSFHDKVGGKDRGKNTVYLFKIDGLNIVHLGDIASEIDDLVDDIGNPDVLFIPVGGEVTYDPKEAVKAVAKLEPRIVIPMHYSSPKIVSETTKTLRPVFEFTKEMGISSEIEEAEQIEITPDQLPEGTVVRLLKITV